MSSKRPAKPKPPLTPELIKTTAQEIGFDAIHIVRVEDVPDRTDKLQSWLGKGHHGVMAWMAETVERRGHPNGLWPQARSVIVLGQNYGPDHDPLEVLDHPDHAAISVYARNRDYHDLIKKRLKRLARWLVEQCGADVKVFVDTAPVMEKPLAASAGLGWQGRHTNLVSREYGSWLFLGSIYTTVELLSDPPEVDHCGSCRSCLDICPTNAFPGPYQIDARRCISYLTIEYKGHIPDEFRIPIGNRIYGCDDCLAVCPWNKFASNTEEVAFQPRESLVAPLLKELVGFDDAAFRAFFTASPIKRIGRDRFTRNVLIAIGNSAQADLLPHAEACLDDASPLVRAMAIWAVGRLASPAHLAQVHAEHGPDSDPDVQAEWDKLKVSPPPAPH